jgi:hypothetical protein
MRYMKLFTLIKRDTPWTQPELTSIAQHTEAHAFKYKLEPEMLVLFGKHDRELLVAHMGTDTFTHHVVTENDPLPEPLLKDIHMEMIKIASTGGDDSTN